MTFLDLCKATRRECGIQGEGLPVSVVTQTGLIGRIVEWVRDADMHVQSAHPDWNFLWRIFTADTTEGSADITKPDDYGMWDRTAFAVDRGTVNGRGLTLFEHEDWRKNNSIKQNSSPTSICILPNGNLKFMNPVNGTYEVYGEYWRSPLYLTDNAQVPLYPERFHRIIIAKAKMWFFEDIESTTQYQQAELEFKEVMSRLESFALPVQQPGNQSSPELMTVKPE